MDKLNQIIARINLIQENQNKLSRIITKIEGKYVLPHELVKEYLSEHKIYKTEYEFAMSTFSGYFPKHQKYAEVISSEFVKAKMAASKSEFNFSIYASHLFKIIEYILDKFFYENPGYSSINLKFNAKNSSGKGNIADSLFYFPVNQKATEKFNQNKIKNPTSTKTIKQFYNDQMSWLLSVNPSTKESNLSIANLDYAFRHFLHFDKDKGVYRSGISASNPNNFNTEMFEVLRYFRNTHSHLKNINPPRKGSAMERFLNSPPKLITSNEATDYVIGYAYLFGLYLNGKSTF